MPIELQHWNEAVRLYREEFEMLIEGGDYVSDYFRSLYLIHILHVYGMASPRQVAMGR